MSESGYPLNGYFGNRTQPQFAFVVQHRKVQSSLTSPQLGLTDEHAIFAAQTAHTLAYSHLVLDPRRFDLGQRGAHVLLFQTVGGQQP